MKKSRILFWIITTTFVLSSTALGLLIPDDNSGTKDNTQYECDVNGNLARCTGMVECVNVQGANFDCVRNKCVYKGSQGPCRDGTAIGQCSKKSPGLRCIEGPTGPSLGKITNDPCCTGGTTPTTQSNGCSIDGWCNPAYGETIQNCPSDCTCNNNGKCDPPKETPETCQDCKGITPDDSTDANYFKDKTISTEEYNRVYFVIYQDRITKGTKFTDNELSDIVEYMNANKDETELSAKLSTTGSKSNEIIGTILMRAGANFGIVHATGPCISNADCPTGQTCQNGVCVTSGACTDHDQCSQACSTNCPAGVFGCCNGCDIGQCIQGTCKCVRSESYCANPAMQVWAQCTSATTTTSGGGTTTTIGGISSWCRDSISPTTGRPCCVDEILSKFGICSEIYSECDKQSNRCIKPNGGCTTNAECPTGQTCLNGVCIDTRGGCFDTIDTDGEACCHDSTNWPGYCYPEEICDTTTGFCVASGGCTINTDCPTGQTCLNGVCVTSGACTDHDQCSQACSTNCPAGVFGCCNGCDIGQCIQGTCKCVRSESYCANPANQVWAQCTVAGCATNADCAAGQTCLNGVCVTSGTTTICNKACSDKGYKYYNCDYNTCQSPFVAISGACAGLGGGSQCCCTNGGTTPTTLAPTGCDYACGGSGYKFYSCSYSTCSAPLHKNIGSCSGLGSGACCCTNCGNGYCSSIDGENAQNCPADCATTPAQSCPSVCGNAGWPYYTCFYSVCQSPLVHMTGSCAGLDAGTCCCSN